MNLILQPEPAPDLSTKTDHMILFPVYVLSPRVLDQVMSLAKTLLLLLFEIMQTGDHKELF